MEIHLARERHQWYIGAVDGVPGSTVHLYLDLHQSQDRSRPTRGDHEAPCGAPAGTVHALGKHFSLAPIEPAREGYAVLTRDDYRPNRSGCGAGASEDPGVSPEFGPDQGSGDDSFDIPSRPINASSRRRQGRQLGGPASADATACEVFLDADDRFFRAFRGAGGTVAEQAERVTARILTLFAAAKALFSAHRGTHPPMRCKLDCRAVLLPPACSAKSCCECTEPFYDFLILVHRLLSLLSVSISCCVRMWRLQRRNQGLDETFRLQLAGTYVETGNHLSYYEFVNIYQTSTIYGAWLIQGAAARGLGRPSYSDVCHNHLLTAKDMGQALGVAYQSSICEHRLSYYNSQWVPRHFLTRVSQNDPRHIQALNAGVFYKPRPAHDSRAAPSGTCAFHLLAVFNTGSLHQLTLQRGIRWSCALACADQRLPCVAALLAAVFRSPPPETKGACFQTGSMPTPSRTNLGTLLAHSTTAVGHITRARRTGAGAQHSRPVPGTRGSASSIVPGLEETASPPRPRPIPTAVAF